MLSSLKAKVIAGCSAVAAVFLAILGFSGWWLRRRHRAKLYGAAQAALRDNRKLRQRMIQDQASEQIRRHRSDLVAAQDTLYKESFNDGHDLAATVNLLDRQP